MSLALRTTGRQLCQAKPAARSSRAAALVVRANREAELAKMAEFKAGLSQTLAATKPSTVAASSASAAAETATEAPAAAGKALREIKKEDYYEAIKEAGSQLVVVDCFTDWCGPCKMIMPTLQQWAEELEGKVVIYKFNCNKHNKELGVSLGIKVAPTFLLYKDGQQVAMMTGAKAEQLRELIEKHM